MGLNVEPETWIPVFTLYREGELLPEQRGQLRQNAKAALTDSIHSVQEGELLGDLMPADVGRRDWIPGGLVAYLPYTYIDHRLEYRVVVYGLSVGMLGGHTLQSAEIRFQSPHAKCSVALSALEPDSLAYLVLPFMVGGGQFRVEIVSPFTIPAPAELRLHGYIWRAKEKVNAKEESSG